MSAAMLDLWQAEGVTFDAVPLSAANDLLRCSHYLGPLTAGGARYVFGGIEQGELVSVMIWRDPTARGLPADGTWLELSRWCLTPQAGENAGSRMHGAFLRWVKPKAQRLTTFVSYSDPSAGHTGALYKACNWWWAPTWHRLRPPPSGNGSWDGETQQAVKDRWVFPVRPDSRRADLLAVQDDACARALEALVA